MSDAASTRLRVVIDHPVIRMATAPNAGPKTLDGTHTYIVGSDPAYVVDPGPDLPAYLDDLAEQLRETGTQVRAILLTHGHPDHAPGAARLAELLGAGVYGSPKIADDAVIGVELNTLSSPMTFPLAEDVIEVLETPGHSEDHLAFWMREARILLAGDTVLGRGTTLVQPPEGNMAVYMETLNRFLTMQPQLLLPGHGPVVTDPQAKLAEYIEHRRLREQQVLQVLHRESATPKQLVDQIYSDLDPTLQTLALGSVEGILQKLVSEQRVIREGDMFQLLESSI
jgi:glyoxylase-like metal-dependent hydrolase (beta-lactamase superfamily II)